jgi:ATP-binding cassette, subfamily G (WHITE), member 2, SNQ2
LNVDFLVSVTDPNGRNVRSGIDPRSIPHTAAEFAAAFEASELGKLNVEDMSRYESECVGNDQRASAFKASAREEHAKHTRPKSPYTISIPMQARAVMMRRVQILKGTLGYQSINMA